MTMVIIAKTGFHRESEGSEGVRSTKKLAFLDRFYKRFCCGAKNHPNGWKKEKRINQKAIRRRLKDDAKRAESEEK